MNRQLALKLVSKMQTNVWDLTDKQAEIILGFLNNDNERSEQLCECKMNKYIEINGRIQTCYKCGKARK